MSHEANAEAQPAHAGKGHLVGNILVFVIMFWPQEQCSTPFSSH